MAIFCGKCGSKVGVTGPCKTCKKIAATMLENAANHLIESRGLTDEDFPAESADAHAVILLDDYAADLRGQSVWHARDFVEVTD